MIVQEIDNTEESSETFMCWEKQKEIMKSCFDIGEKLSSIDTKEQVTDKTEE